MAEASKPRRRRQARRAAPEQAPARIDATSLDTAFVKALAADFLEHGPTAIAAMRDTRPTDYVKLVAAVLPKDANHAADPLQEMSDAELDSEIEELAQQLGYQILPAESPRRAGTAADEDADGN